LRPGMTKSQVRFIMGTPLIQDSFHGNRWDYAYQLREGGKLIEQRRVILDFQNELLKTVRGDVVAASVDSKAGTEGPDAGPRIIEPAKKSEEKSLMQKLKFWQKDEAEIAKEAADAKAKAGADEVARKAAEAERAAAKTKAVAPIAVEPSPTVRAVKPEPEQKIVVPVQVIIPEATSTPTPPSQPSSGLKIDKSLSGKAPDSKAVQEVATPRSTNAVAPKAKEMPAENEPGFFDQMLEKIGF